MWHYEFSKEAEKSLENTSAKTKNLLTRKIKNIGEWLDGKSDLVADIRKLRGEWEGFYRLRVAKIRVLFSVDEEADIIRIHAIGSRGDVYK